MSELFKSINRLIYRLLMLRSEEISMLRMEIIAEVSTQFMKVGRSKTADISVRLNCYWQPKNHLYQAVT
jgi:hypothetical protein